MNTFNSFTDRIAQNKKSFTVLIDPDKLNLESVPNFITNCVAAGVDYIFIGGSLIISPHFKAIIKAIKALNVRIPVIIFPGGVDQISRDADAILYLSLLSGRNPEYLIGNQLKSAPIIKKMQLESISTAYLLIESGATTSVEFISNTKPIPANKPEIAAAHGLTAELLGFKQIYLEAGSGALNAVPNAIIKATKSATNLPLIVGGGIREPKVANEKVISGADMVVIGNFFENNFSKKLLVEFSQAIHI